MSHPHLLIRRYDTFLIYSYGGFIMARIGMFTTEADGSLTGSIKTLSIATNAKLVPAEPTPGGKGPAFRVYAGLAEIGAAWKQVGQSSGVSYHSVKLDAPELAAPINARLFATKDKPGSFDLVWERPQPADRQPGQDG